MANNHFTALGNLEKLGFISKHPLSRAAYPIYVADRVFPEEKWSERQDSNLRRLAPKASALPG